MEDQLAIEFLNVWTALAAMLGVGVFAYVKKFTTLLDGKFTQWIKPVQPVVVAAASILLPIIANALHLVEIPDAALFASGPIATVILVALREIKERIIGNKDTPEQIAAKKAAVAVT
jgi:uncharacterized membrane protein YoaK (UPF0700 family)